MAIPTVTEQNILDAIKYIDENDIPKMHKSTVYELIINGKPYPPKYVIAVANHIGNGKAISTDGYNAVEAKNYFQTRGYVVEKREEKFELVIEADNLSSSDKRFSMMDITQGDGYKPLDVYFRKANGEIIYRNYAKGEKRNSNQTMPRIACQVFEKEIANLTVQEKKNFPICRYTPNSEMICGIFSTVEEYRMYRNTIEYLTYSTSTSQQFVFYCWNIFSTIIFVQECLKRFGNQGDQFILSYREKDEKEIKQVENDSVLTEELVQQFNGYKNPYSLMLVQSKNIIFRGAPGTGKTYLAKEIAADIISNGYFDDYTLLSDEQKKQIEFVQFHPSYDYSDFVEGLRPKVNSDGSLGFELKEGIFTKFVNRARTNYENSMKSKDEIKQKVTAHESMVAFFESIEFGIDAFETLRGSKFYITGVDDSSINISIPGNETSSKLSINIDEIRMMLESGKDFERVSDVTNFFGKQFASQGHSYEFALYKEIREKHSAILHTDAKIEELKKYIFIIDEINRGEISKIFGELFFSIDPGYRGSIGAVSTQYANMHADPDYKFYIPENVYIIGTMNDIDRSVESFDFAMRRRFRFIEVKASDRLEMLDALHDETLQKEIKMRMSKLNEEIANVEELNENYQIGASYFLKLKNMSFDELWTDCIYPLLQEYVRGMCDEAGIMNKFAKAYGYKCEDEGKEDGSIQN